MLLSTKGSLITVVGIAAGCVAAPALTQTSPQRGDTVLERFRPDYSPLGLGQGGMVLFPSLVVSEQYDDNILASDNGARDDFVTTIEPQLKVRSQWSSHQLDLEAGARVERYVSETNEDAEAYKVGGSARIDITKDTRFDLAANFQADQENRNSPDDAGGIKPTDYTFASSRVGFANRWNRLSLSLEGGGDIFDYDDSTGVGGAQIDGDDRDRKKYRGTVRIGYEIQPEYEVFVRGGYNKIVYDEGLDSSGFNRDSDGFEVTAGARIDITGVLFGDIFAGYRRQSYDDARLEDFGAPTFGGGLTWNVTRLTTVKASIERDVVETTQVDSPGYFKTAYTASIDHELLRNLIIGGESSLIINEYKGNGRDDEEYKASLYVRYLMHRHLYLSARYSYERRDSNAVGADYDKNVFMLRLETQF